MDSSTRIFRRGIISQLAIPVCLLAPAAVLAWLEWVNPQNTNGKLSVAMVLAGLALIIWAVRHYSCVITGPDGIRVKRVGYTLFSSWDNILDIEYRAPAVIELKNSGLQTRLPSALRPCVIGWRYQFTYPGCHAALTSGKLITLTPFDYHIKSTRELRSAIRQHWPRTDRAQPRAPVACEQTQSAALTSAA